MTLPITIIGGYLGSGKTTLVNHLLRNADGKRLAVLVNEFGELPIDADLIEGQEGDVIALAGGCVCCSYGDDLTSTLIDIAKSDPAPDHVLLEASGVAIPGSIAHSLALLNGYTLDGILVLADAETVQERAADKYVGDTVRRQLADADIAVLNKTDLVSDAERQTTAQWLNGQTRGAAIVETRNGSVAPIVVLRNFMRPDSGSRAHAHHQLEQFETRHLEMNHPVDAEALARKLAASGIVRAKGFVKAKDGSLKTIQVVGQRWDIIPAPARVSTGIVVIGTKPLCLDGIW